MKIIIPVGVVVLAAIVVLVLWLTGVLTFGQGKNSPPQPTTTRETSRGGDEDDTSPSPQESQSPRPTIAPTTSPTQDPPPVTPTQESPTVPTGGVIPGRGGDVSVSGPGEFSFTPDSSGMWTIRTILNYDCDPYLTLYDSRGMIIEENDDGSEDGNSFMIVQLDAGSTYTIDAGFYDDSGSYTLHVSPADTIPPGGGDVRINGGLTGYIFTPNQSADWTFTTSNNGTSDPYVVIFNALGNYIAYDDDSLDGINAICTV